ncbi:MAG: hypothetical protein IKC93_06710 [Candidatus Methanomethylophilaceae archaeon]|nr:hypothetical protein [Candidatus Methanomethylophilaceae archaeon]
MTIGTGLTATAIELDLLDRMIVCDRYAALDNHSLFNGLRSKIGSDQIMANGSGYSTGLGSVKNDIWTMTEKIYREKGIDLEGVDHLDVKDIAIFMTGVPSSINELYDDLSDARLSYKHILCWDTIDSYDDLIDMVRTMSLVMKGVVDPHVDEMESIVDYIETILSGNPGMKRREAFYVTYSGGELKVGNMGSLANSMIEAAGGISITNDASMSKTYAANIPRLIEGHGTDMVIFVDDVLASNESSMDTLKKALGGQDVKLVRLDPLWNNYCIESMNGVWAMACAMYSDVYPDVFVGDVPVISNDYDDDIVLYTVAGLLGAAMISVLAFLYFRT